MKTLIVFALPFENQVKSLIPHNITIFICGVGKEMASSNLTKHLSTHKYDLIINLGICGSIKPDISINSVFSINEVIEGDYSPLNIDFPRLTLALINKTPFPSTSIVTQDKIINTKEQIVKIKTLKSFLVDMECYSLAKTAKLFNTPFSAIKIVSDHCNSQTNKLKKEDIIKSSKILTNHFLQFFIS